MIDFNDCLEQNSNKKIPLEEKRSKITFINNNKLLIRKIKIDDCVIQEGKRCDWLLILPSNEEYFIELKGCDLHKAVDQIETTIPQVSSNPKTQTKICFIIVTRCPLVNPEIQGIKFKFKKRFNSQLIIKNSPYEYEI